PRGALAFIKMFLDPAFHTKWVRVSGYVPPTRAIRDSKQYKNLVSVWSWNQVAATTIPDARFVPLGPGGERVETALRRELSRTHERLAPSVEDGLAALKQTISSVTGKHSLPDDQTVTVRFAPSSVKLRPGEDWHPFTTSTVDLDMALNETESFQIVIATHRTDNVKVTDVKLNRPQSSPSSRLSPCTIDVLHIEDIEIAHPLVSGSAGLYPDVLVPWHGPESVEPEKPIRLWIRVFVGGGATPGFYRGTVRIETNDGRSTVAPWTLRVHEVRIPKTPRLSATAGLNFDRLAARFGMDRQSAEFRKVADKYYDFLLNYRITPYRPPVKVGSPESRPYLDDPRVTSFVFPYDEDDQTLNDTADTLRSWNLQDHAFFYVEDEPFHGMYARVIETGLRADKLAPDFAYMMTTPPTKDFAGLVDIWCLHVGFRPISTPSSIGDIRNAVWDIEQARVRGERIWWYTAGAVSPLPTLHIDDDAVAPRIMPWLQPLYGITGFLQWEVANWVNDDPYTEPLIPPFGNGEGVLIYPPRVAQPLQASTPPAEYKDEKVQELRKPESVSTQGTSLGDQNDTTPIPSVRLELLRDGLEDYELLYTLGAAIDIVNKQLGPIEWNYSGAVRMREYAHRFIKSDARERAARQWVFFMTETNRDPNLFAQARHDLFGELASITVPPLVLVATHPAEGSYTTDTAALVEVATEPGSTVWINGLARNSMQTGYIRARVDLDPGPNRIEVRVEKNGNVKTLIRTVYRTGNITEINDRQQLQP
ncbi:MAG: DUF4091 domain-containing protein, partial [Candidatus Hydrogenedentes bacterium]|nr:DUF4091 domain-containing protein [Candidatus Hydrogenedentota bacterium]